MRYLATLPVWIIKQPNHRQLNCHHSELRGISPHSHYNPFRPTRLLALYSLTQ